MVKKQNAWNYMFYSYMNESVSCTKSRPRLGLNMKHQGSPEAAFQLRYAKFQKPIGCSVTLGLHSYLRWKKIRKSHDKKWTYRHCFSYVVKFTICCLISKTSMNSSKLSTVFNILIICLGSVWNVEIIQWLVNNLL